MDSWLALGTILLILLVIGVGHFLYSWCSELGITDLALNLGVAVAGLAIILYWPTNAFAWFFGVIAVALGGFNSRHMIGQLRSKGHLLADHREESARNLRRNLRRDAADD